MTSAPSAWLLFTLFQGALCVWGPGAVQPQALSPERESMSLSRLAVSGDGTACYFSASHNLWQGSTTGAAPRKLTTRGHATVVDEEFAEPHDCDCPLLSPDGRCLAYRYMPDTGAAQVWLLDLQTGKDSRLADDADLGPGCWTADGSAIVFEKGQSLWRVEVATGSLSQVTRCPAGARVGDGQPTFGPDGTLAFTRDFDLWLLPPNSTTARRLTNTGYLQWPTWSPDGKRLAAYASRRAGEEEDADQWDEIHLVDLNGTAKRLVSTSNAPEGTLSAAQIIGWLSNTELLINRNVGEAPPKVYAIDVNTGLSRLLLKLRDGDEMPTLWVPGRQ